MPSPRQNKRGYLLVEAALSAGIMALVLNTLVGEVARARSATVDAQLRMAATRAVQQRQEVIRTVAYDSLSTVVQSWSAVPSNPALQWQTTVVAGTGTVPIVGTYNFTTVTVSVRYTLRGITQTIEVPLVRMPS